MGHPCYILDLIYPLGTFCPLGCFVPGDVLSFGTFCPLGRFVPWDVLSLGTFCPWDVLSWEFCLGSFVLGRFVCASNRGLGGFSKLVLWIQIQSGSAFSNFGSPYSESVSGSAQLRKRQLTKIHRLNSDLFSHYICVVFQKIIL